jgi:hypothetical protein
MMHAGAQTTVPSPHRRGENGHAELAAEGLGEPLLALFDKTLCGLDEARISSFVADINVDYAPLRHKVWNMFARQLKADEEELAAAKRQGRSPKLSLAAKYAPSQGGQHSRVLKADKEIYKILFPAFALASSEAASAKYRRLLSNLRRALAVPEVLMCAQKWAEINFAKVSSLCLDRHTWTACPAVSTCLR